MIEKDLVVSLKSVCERIFPLIMPQNVVFPAMTYQVVYDSSNISLNGNLKSRDVRFQVDIYSKSYSEAKALKGLVNDKVIELGGGSVSTIDLYDDEQKLFRQLIDFNIKRT